MDSTQVVPRTRRKLDEAKFFLSHMPLQSWPRTQDSHDWDVFGFYLSAFVNAARSVTWVLQNENRQLYDRVHTGWDAERTPEDHDLFKFMNERRLDEVKRTGAEFQHNITPVPMTTLQMQRLGYSPHLIMQQIPFWASRRKTVARPTPKIFAASR